MVWRHEETCPVWLEFVMEDATVAADSLDRRYQLLTVKEAGDQLRKSESQMRWLMHTGKAPKHGKIGGRVMFRQSDIDAYIAEAFGD